MKKKNGLIYKTKGEKRIQNHLAAVPPPLGSNPPRHARSRCENSSNAKGSPLLNEGERAAPST